MLPARLLLIDDHTLFRTGLRLMLSGLPTVSGILDSESIMDAVSHHAQTSVDLILLDISLPGISGLEGVKLLQRVFPNARILIVSGSDSLTSEQIVQLGVAGFLSKTAEAREIEQAIERALTQGGPVLSSSPREGAAAGLTPRQLEVLGLLAQGQSNRAIANRLGVAENTVRVHVSAVLDFLGVSSRTEALLEAQRRGLIRL